MSRNREAQITGFLLRTKWETWQRTPIAADASDRQYTRLINGNDSVVLMDAPPETGQQTEPFAKVSHWLLLQGLSPPQILRHDASLGLMLLEDLGPYDVAAWIRYHADESKMLYQTACDVLIRLDSANPPEHLPVMTASVGGEMLDVTAEWYANEPADRTLAPTMADALKRLCGPPEHIALRDFHAENLIWRPARKGLQRIGLLDFQDAFLAPRGYDLVSLIRDIRRDVETDVANQTVAHFIAPTDADPDQFAAAIACLGAQRNLRILGVFARLIRRDQKTRYAAMIPRVWTLIQQDLGHPELRDLRDVVTALLPPPERSAIKAFI